MYILLGDEMFSDTYKMKLVDDVLYEVYGKVYIYIYLQSTCFFCMEDLCNEYVRYFPVDLS